MIYKDRDFVVVVSLSPHDADSSGAVRHYPTTLDSSKQSDILEQESVKRLALMIQHVTTTRMVPARLVFNGTEEYIVHNSQVKD